MKKLEMAKKIIMKQEQKIKDITKYLVKADKTVSPNKNVGGGQGISVKK